MSWLFKEFPVPPAKAGSLMPSPRGDYFALSPRRSGDLGAPGAMGASDRAGVPVGRSAADPGDRLGLSEGRPQAHGLRARLPSQERRYFWAFQGVSRRACEGRSPDAVSARRLIRSEALDP